MLYIINILKFLLFLFKLKSFNYFIPNFKLVILYYILFNFLLNTKFILFYTYEIENS